jgi:hypothetical protein
MFPLPLLVVGMEQSGVGCTLTCFGCSKLSGSAKSLSSPAGQSLLVVSCQFSELNLWFKSQNLTHKIRGERKGLKIIFFLSLFLNCSQAIGNHSEISQFFIWKV